MILKRAINIIVSLLLFSLAGNAQEDASKTTMKVLYVGYDPAKPILRSSQFRDASSERYEMDVISRWPAFNIYLKRRFTDVTSVDARDYREEMSSDHDVTIFDELTPPIREEIREQDENGQIVKYVPPAYLSEEYHHATIFMGKVAPDMGGSLGSKLDWYCLCLGGDALNIKTDHPIFNTPTSVELTLEMKKTPDNFYAYPNSENIPKQIPTWRVQGLDYENADYAIGMVSRGNGFLDSPDTEYISGGNNSKDINAVALGRHGNFFLWGFSASPDHMTDEALDVFANTIVYMKQFKGARLIAKKMDVGVAIRDTYVTYKNRDISVEKFESYKKQWLEIRQKDIARKKELEAKKAKGEKLNKYQEAFLNKVDPVPTLEAWLPNKYRMGERYFKKFGTDLQAYKQYLNENVEYLIYNPQGNPVMEVDEDVKEMGVSNRKPELLGKSIEWLQKKGKKAALAQRVLERYTEESFSNAGEWENWFRTNRDRLFFTEAGGYKWLVNTLKTVP